MNYSGVVFGFFILFVGFLLTPISILNLLFVEVTNGIALGLAISSFILSLTIIFGIIKLKEKKK